jgi:hypothetical protein
MDQEGTLYLILEKERKQKRLKREEKDHIHHPAAVHLTVVQVDPHLRENRKREINKSKIIRSEK